MLPKSVSVIYPPNNRDSIKYKNEIKDLINMGYKREQIDKMLLTQKDRQRVLKEMNIKPETVFHKFFTNYSDEPKVERYEELYGLEEIYEDYKNPFWGREYPNITDRYLQLSSIEGEHSYFYDKETDAVYDVDWSEMDDFMAGKIKPRWKSFYDFLEWYYGDEEE